MVESIPLAATAAAPEGASVGTAAAPKGASVGTAAALEQVEGGVYVSPLHIPPPLENPLTIMDVGKKSTVVEVTINTRRHIFQVNRVDGLGFHYGHKGLSNTRSKGRSSTGRHTRHNLLFRNLGKSLLFRNLGKPSIVRA